MSLKINKQSVKTKQLVEKLTDKYCPMAKEMARIPKSYAHNQNLVGAESINPTNCKQKPNSHPATNQTKPSHTISRNPQQQVIDFNTEINTSIKPSATDLSLPQIANPASKQSRKNSSTGISKNMPHNIQYHSGPNMHSSLKPNNTPIDRYNTIANKVEKQNYE